MAQIIRMWDRQSTRHNWQIYATSENPDRIDALIDIHLGRLIDNPKHHGAQIATDTTDSKPWGYLTTRDDISRPRNAKMDRIISVEDHIDPEERT